jgi:myo-inositol-1(or 4)-monophosphatase
VTVEDLLELFDAAALVQRDAVASVTGTARRRRTERPGQYELDVVADVAVLEVLHQAPVAVVSEESGRSGLPRAPVTVVVDPVDGSTNCARDLPYWAISLCAVDAQGPLCSLVANQATGVRTTATRGGGAYRDGVAIRAAPTHTLSDAVVALSGLPPRRLGWAQARALGSEALALCDLAAGGIDGYLDAGSWSAPWDYLGALLACREVGAPVVDADERELVTTDPAVRRQIIGASTPELLDELRPALTP